MSEDNEPQISAQTLYDRYQADLKVLQASCTHPEKHHSDWMDQYWAPGHGTGRQIRICTFCHSKIDERGNGYPAVDFTNFP